MIVVRKDHTASFEEDRWTKNGIIFSDMISEFGIKTLSWDPLGEYLAVGDQDGSVCVFAFEGATCKIVRFIEKSKNLDYQLPIDNETEIPIVWHPSGAVLAVASDSGVNVFSRADLFSKAHPLNPSSERNAVDTTTTLSSNALCWSPNGRFLASADAKRGLNVWDFSIPVSPLLPTSIQPMKLGGRVTGEDGETFDSAAVITSIAWTQDGHTLLYADYDGNVGVAKMKYLYKSGASAVEPLKAAFSWPLIMDAAANKSAVEDEVMEKETIHATTTAATTTAAAMEGEGETQRLGVLGDGDEDMNAVVAAAAAVEPPKELVKKTAIIASKFVDDETVLSQLPLEDAFTLALQQKPRVDKIVDDEEEEEEGEGASSSSSSSAVIRPEATVANKKKEAKDDGEDSDVFDGVEANLTLEKNKLGFKDAEDGISGLVPFSRPLLGEKESTHVEFTREDFRMMLEAEMRLVLKNVDKHHGLLRPQAAFQSGSSPFMGSSRRSPRRYLAWNSVGSITSRKEPGQNIVDVDFVDSQMHRSVHFTDPYGFTMATLSESGILYAAPFVPSDSGSEGQSALIKFFPIGSHYGTGNEWIFNFPVSNSRVFVKDLPLKTTLSASSFVKAKMAAADELALEDEDKEEDQDEDKPGDEENEIDSSSAAESPVAVALGDGFAVAATDRQMLRFVRTGGIQDAVILVPGAVVTVAAKGALCAVAYHRSAPSERTQRIAVDVYIYTPVSITTSSSSSSASFTGAPRLLKTVDLPLRPDTMLQWFDFSSNGILMAHTTGGILMSLQPAQNWAWTAVCDTTLAFSAGKKSKKVSNDKCWPVHVSVCSSEAFEQQQQSMASSTGSSSVSSATYSQDLSCMPKGANIPLLHGCLLKGRQMHPNVSTPKPLVTPIALQVPLLDCANPENTFFDSSFVKAESLRAHRLWCDSMGLSSDKGAVVTSVHTAMSTASFKARGHAVPDAVEGTKDLLRASWKSGNEETKALDRSVLRMVSSACNNQLDARATQLACRLIGDKAATQASKMASLASRNAVHERIIQIMLVKKSAADALAQAQVVAPVVAPAAAALPPPPQATPTIATPPPQTSSSSSSLPVAPSTLPTTSSRSLSSSSQAYEDTAMMSSSSSTSAAAAAGQSSSSSLSSRPFAKKTNALSSPSRNVNNKRGLESLAAESPARVGDKGKGGGGAAGGGGALFQPLLARQSSFAAEERTKRLKEMSR